MILQERESVKAFSMPFIEVILWLSCWMILKYLIGLPVEASTQPCGDPAHTRNCASLVISSRRFAIPPHRKPQVIAPHVHLVSKRPKEPRTTRNQVKASAIIAVVQAGPNTKIGLCCAGLGGSYAGIFPCRNETKSSFDCPVVRGVH